MVKAENIAVALVIFENQEWFVAGYTFDVQKLYDAGLAERVWLIKLDNGHRPYPVLKRRVDFAMIQDGDLLDNSLPRNNLTAKITRSTGIITAHNLYDLEQTYLFRKTPEFWTDLWVGFAGEGGTIDNINTQEYYAIYRGYIMRNISGIKFIRI